ncbi:Bacterial regulatory proteins, luxR family [Thalassovita gelatinovora]|uniref:Bacterial regulatory proteins, luxR family n=1 Tax=Thalassovita gelatinovora TaxID=53501 RepID=A0A0P1FL20_THAGE|nr:helix-turn-helix transcriptional regulator [Thalassovita gelatinovora]QIZ79019.1 helix-turn-helix transcriptional regulator [Thalassovita gelatinovora]CUH68581.1 Bacterial regulatory proteins, luxR family [Thalassovita gelatinovora]SEQ54965.1 regulatory protein, luxR family [Thalassovita gelatinovora]
MGLGFLILAQSFAAFFFLSDIFFDFIKQGSQIFSSGDTGHLILEVAAALTLILSVVFETRYLIRLLLRQEQLTRGMQIASGALHDLMLAYYEDWRLTPSEQDVAGFAIKGASIAEIAELRGTAQGTIKAHLNAIYRKAGVSGRGELISLLIEDLMSVPLLQGDGAQSIA